MKYASNHTGDCDCESGWPRVELIWVLLSGFDFDIDIDFDFDLHFQLDECSLV